jgi:hypothetical protein
MLLHKGRCHPGGETEEHRLREVFEDTVRVGTHDEIDLSHNFVWEHRIHVGGAFELFQKRRFSRMREDVTDPVEPEDVEAIPVYVPMWAGRRKRVWLILVVTLESDSGV